METQMHDCGGTILVGGAGERHRYCDRCHAFTYKFGAEIPSGTDKTANLAAWNAGDEESAESESRSFRDCWCTHCGHPVMADGVSIDPSDDVDGTGFDRPRCEETACSSHAVATYSGNVLVPVEG